MKKKITYAEAINRAFQYILKNSLSLCIRARVMESMVRRINYEKLTRFIWKKKNNR